MEYQDDDEQNEIFSWADELEDDELFIWDKKNIEHIARHKIETFEAEEAMLDENRIRFPAHSDHLGLIGATEDGRRLVVIYVKKVGEKYRIITARNAELEEKKLYNKRRNKK